MLSTEDHGKDLASVTNLLKKHQLMEADIAAHDVRIVQRCALCQPSCLISLHLFSFLPALRLVPAGLLDFSSPVQFSASAAPCASRPA